MSSTAWTRLQTYSLPRRKESIRVAMPSPIPRSCSGMKKGVKSMVSMAYFDGLLPRANGLSIFINGGDC